MSATTSTHRRVIAISGGLGSGKASLAAALAETIGAARVSFGAEVRRAVEAAGADPSDLDALQRIGQALVVQDSDGLVGRVLAQDTGPADAPLVVAGVRHVEVWCDLLRRFPLAQLVHIDVPDEVRAERLMQRRGMERRLAARFDNALSEVQISRILPQYAATRVNGTLPVGLQVGWVVSRLALAAHGPERGKTAGGRADG